MAAVVGSKCRGVLAGFVLLSYPLKVAPRLDHDVTMLKTRALPHSLLFRCACIQWLVQRAPLPMLRARL